jgi:glycosyltransferase involved in cell wall biosynthesis
MRIAYIAPYHGPTMLERRPIVRNRSMSGALKIELIASLLRARAHEVEVISQGEVVDPAFRLYPSFSEMLPGGLGIPVHYASALPVRRINGLWSNTETLRVLKSRHRSFRYDLVIIYNLKGPQLTCADYAMRRLGLPVVLEYEDDRFVNVQGHALNGFSLKRDIQRSKQLFQSVSGCMAVSPHLRAQLPADIPGMLLRGVVGSDLLRASRKARARKNVVLFSGTHIASNGVAELIEAWRLAALPGWELHITGYGGLTESLRQMAQAVPGVVFRGLISRTDLVDLMCSAKICANPHQLSATPGNVFAFKIIEYLASGAHVITTPMGALEPDLERGITYMPDNTPARIAATLREVVERQLYHRTAPEAAQRAYGPEAVSQSLDVLLQQVSARRS